MFHVEHENLKTKSIDAAGLNPYPLSVLNFERACH
jgi:hypothetical protein